jgi:hypothetical protein
MYTRTSASVGARGRSSEVLREMPGKGRILAKESHNVQALGEAGEPAVSTDDPHVRPEHVPDVLRQRTDRPRDRFGDAELRETYEHTSAAVHRALQSRRCADLCHLGERAARERQSAH